MIVRLCRRREALLGRVLLARGAPDSLVTPTFEFLGLQCDRQLTRYWDRRLLLMIFEVWHNPWAALRGQSSDSEDNPWADLSAYSEESAQESAFGAEPSVLGGSAGRSDSEGE